MARAREQLRRKNDVAARDSRPKKHGAAATFTSEEACIGRADVVSQDREKTLDFMRGMIESMIPRSPVPLPAHVLQARRNAAAREALMQEFGALTSTQLGELAGSKAGNQAALAHRWKTDGRIFSVPHHGTNYFPGFQFSSEGTPLPVIARVLEVLAGKLSAWEIALWFTGSNGWLGGARPVDFLHKNADRIVEAARQETEERVF